MKSNRIRVMNVLYSFGTDGAEKQLLALMKDITGRILYGLLGIGDIQRAKQTEYY